MNEVTFQAKIMEKVVREMREALVDEANADIKPAIQAWLEEYAGGK